MRNQRHYCSSWTALVVVVLLLVAAAYCDASTASSSPPPFSPQRIRDWIRAKCGNEGSAVWVYEGALYDPVDGRTIAHVEGLELVRQLASSDDDDDTQRRSNLKASKIQGDYSTTVLSRKLFCYQSPQQPRRLLDSIRLRPNAPVRKIPTNQAIALYDSATTYTCRNNGQQLVLHTEWPNGKCTWGTTASQQQQANDHQSMDFVVFARPTNKDVPDLTESTFSSDDDTDKHAGVVASPKRSQLVQFGASSQQQANQHKFGARETYSYTMPSSSSTGIRSNWLFSRFFRRRKHDNNPDAAARVKYTRYGEGPPWYGPGKYCMLELRGRRVASVAEAPPLAASYAAERVPGFLSVDAPIASDASAKRAVEWFRRQGSNLQITLEDEESERDQAPSPDDGGRLRRLAYQVKKRGSKVFQRVRAASTLESNIS